MCLFVCLSYFSPPPPFSSATANLRHEASKGQALIYTNSLPHHSWIWGVITWVQNGFISFNLAAAAICGSDICICRVDRVKQLGSSGSLKCKQRAIIKNNNICQSQQYYSRLIQRQFVFSFTGLLRIWLFSLFFLKTYFWQFAFF